MSVIRNNEVVISSPLPQDTPLNDHLVWLWGMLKHERRFLKSVVQAGGALTIECKVPKGQVRLLPNGAQLVHLLGAELVLNTQ